MRRGLNLQAQIRRRVQEKVTLVVVGNCDLGLSTSLALESPGARGLAVMAVAIPLRKPASCGRAQDFDAHSYIAALA